MEASGDTQPLAGTVVVRVVDREAALPVARAAHVNLITRPGRIVRGLEIPLPAASDVHLYGEPQYLAASAHKVSWL
jgi:hypothetical protein